MHNFTGIKKASAELLTKMDVALTDAGKAALLGASSTQTVQAETALAKGITAQKSGTIVEALSYYYKAAEFDPKLLEATGRAAVMSANISSGNIGENVRNEIQRRNEWKKLLDECDEFFRNNIPCEIIYNPTLTQEHINYESETVILSFKAEIKPTDLVKVYLPFIEGLEKTGKRKEWRLEGFPADETHNSYVSSYKVIVNFGLYNENGKLVFCPNQMA
ncbi:hypothetical protein FACS1894190_17870 [Spirochaetia bacterium]|nr:hypothetical protein FACS1894190_17870 [Spirochaetia bacterium]